MSDKDTAPERDATNDCDDESIAAFYAIGDDGEAPF